MEITKLLQLKKFIDKLCGPFEKFNPQALPEVEICFTDRFNEYEIDDCILGIDNNVIQISCRKKGSALEGKHRVMGKDK